MFVVTVGYHKNSANAYDGFLEYKTGIAATLEGANALAGSFIIEIFINVKLYSNTCYLNDMINHIKNNEYDDCFSKFNAMFSCGDVLIKECQYFTEKELLIHLQDKINLSNIKDIIK